jgi:hypothetical protein
VRSFATLSYIETYRKGDVNSKELRQTEQAVVEYRAKINTHMPENYGFVSFATVPCAHAVAQVLERKRPGGTKFILTPDPKDIVRRITTAFCGAMVMVTLRRYGKTWTSPQPR